MHISCFLSEFIIFLSLLLSELTKNVKIKTFATTLISRASEQTEPSSRTTQVRCGDRYRLNGKTSVDNRDGQINNLTLLLLLLLLLLSAHPSFTLQSLPSAVCNHHTGMTSRRYCHCIISRRVRLCRARRRRPLRAFCSSYFQSPSAASYSSEQSDMNERNEPQNAPLIANLYAVDAFHCVHV